MGDDGRVLPDIDVPVIRDGKGLIAFIMFLLFIILMYLVYLKPINRPDPTICGLSKAFAYSIIVWIYGMIAVFYAALEGWR